MDKLAWFQERIGRRTSEESPSLFGRWLDGTLTVAERDRFVVEFDVRPEMVNPAGVLHGGVTAGMFDDVFGMLAMSKVTPRGVYLSINLHVDYLEGARLGDRLSLEVRTARHGGSILNMDGELAHEGRLVAKASTIMAFSKRAGVQFEAAPSGARGVHENVS